jgi:outer membrane receptor protein involved in Fe transport
LRKPLLWFAAAAALAPACAFAQAPQPAAPPKPAPAAKPPAAPKGGTVGEVVVTGQGAAPVVTSIDRRSYSVTGDLQTTTGTIGDALRNIPSVQVDVQGNVTLRGDPNVTILIDGKPSGVFRGDSRAAALQQIPADRIDRVEVITNPSAEFRADGTAGIINLITKQAKGIGRTGSLRANLGSSERGNVSLIGGYNSKQLNLSGDLGYRRDTQKRVLRDARSRLDTATGGFADSFQTSDSRVVGDFLSGRGSFDYDRDAQNRLSGEIRANHVDARQRGLDHFEREDGAGRLVQFFNRPTRYSQERTNGEVSGTWRRKYAGDGHELVVTASHEETKNDLSRLSVTNNFVPAVPATADTTRTLAELKQNELKADYTRPMDGGVKLKAGYDLEIDDDRLEVRSERGLAGQPLVVDPNFTNLFLVDQTVHQAYVTYERPIGDITALAGLRVENVDIDLNQVTQAIRGDNDYWRVHPSLHLSYKASDTQTFTASYSHRLSRPQTQDLNPFRIFIDPFNLRAGNPNLLPQETNSFELGWQYRKAPTFYLATLYYRQSSKVFTDVVRDIGGGVFLTTRENASHNRAGGLELVANSRLTKTLTYNVSGNAFWQELDSGIPGFPGKRDAVTLFGRANLNWQATAKDFVQINVVANGKRLTPQGYGKPTGMLNLGYRHKVDDKLSFVVTAQDVLGTFRDLQVIDTPTLKARIRRSGDVRQVQIGFIRSFGGGRRPEPGFDFGGGQAAPGP